MKEKIVKVYEFAELPEDVQDKILENMRFVNVEDTFWHDYDGKTGFTSKELKRMRVNPYDGKTDELLTWKNMYFDLDRSWYIQFTDAQFENDEIARKFLRVPRELWDNVHWMFENNRKWTTKLTYEHQDNYKDFTPKQVEILDRAVDIFSDKMEEALKGLRDNYEYLTTEEAIKETIDCNEYEFTIDGKFA